MSGDQASRLLWEHLGHKTPFSAEEDDNLMSWTSSLLYAIQYAVYRAKWRKPGDVRICIVDSGTFPEGQFAQDLWLLKRYTKNVKECPELKNLLDLRSDTDYYNGEHLSQGLLDHTGRSCLVSLEDLRAAGLFELYPEFGEKDADAKWTIRARDLRRKWSAPQGTNDQEIRLALNLVRTCFSDFDSIEMASTLLTFKNRKLTRADPAGKCLYVCLY
jgi:hypothetical protein